MNVFPQWPLVGLAVVAVVVAVWALLARGADPSRRARLAGWRRVGLAVLLLGIAFRPTVGHTLTVTYTSGADIVFMVDRTTSMGAEDYDGDQPRMVGVRADMQQLVESLPGSRFAVVVFDNNGRVAIPFTTDAMAVASFAQTLDWRASEFGDGTDITEGVAAAQELLARSAEQHPQVQRYVVYLGDGEQTRRTPPGSLAPLAPHLDGALVLGYGTPQGGAMKTAGYGDDYVMVDGQRALSRIDEATLQALAEEMHGSYEHRTAPGPLALHIAKAEPIRVEKRDPRGFETYWILALAMVAGLAWELWDVVAELRRARKELL